MTEQVEVQKRGIVPLYGRGCRYAVHPRCGIDWELAPVCEVISLDPPVIRRTIMPRVPSEPIRRREAL